MQLVNCIRMYILLFCYLVNLKSYQRLIHDLIDQAVPLQYRHLVHQLVRENTEFYDSIVQILLEHMGIVELCAVEVMPTTIQEAGVMSTLSNESNSNHEKLSDTLNVSERIESNPTNFHPVSLSI